MPERDAAWVDAVARGPFTTAFNGEDMDFVTSRGEPSGDFVYVNRTSGTTRDVLVGRHVENLQTASSSKKNGPVRTRPKSATSSFMIIVASASGG